MRKFFIGVWLLLSAMAAQAAAPDQLYQTWQKTYLRDPDTAERAAQDYLHAAPQGPHAADLQIWLDAYHKAMASILSQPRTANKNAPANSRASAQPAAPPSPPPAPPPQPVAPAARQAAAPQDRGTQEFRILADVYHKTLAGLGLTAGKNAPASRRASAQPAAPPSPPPAPPPKRVAQQIPPMPAALHPPRTPSLSPPKPEAVQARQLGAPAVNLAAVAPALPKQVPPPAPEPVRQAAVPPAPEARPQTRLASAEPVPQKPLPAQPPTEKPLGQSLDETLAFIADKIEGRDPLAFTAEFVNAAGGALVEQLSYEASNVTIDPNRCQVSYRWHVRQDGRRIPDQDRAVQLRLSRAITVQTIEQALAALNARHFSVRVRPEAWAVHIARWDRPAGDNLYFRDKGMAESVAAAARHALDMCDGRRR